MEDNMDEDFIDGPEFGVEVEDDVEAEVNPLSQESFSFFDVLAERTYPKDTVTLYMDEQAGYDLIRLSVESDEVDGEPEDEEEQIALDKKVTEFQERLSSLQKRIANSAFTLHLTGVSNDRLGEVQGVVDKEFRPKKIQRKNAQGRIEKYLPESEKMAYAHYFSAVVNSLYIERIEQHSTGRVMVAPGVDEVAELLRKAPRHELAKLQTKIAELDVNSSQYENSIDEGFLAKS